MTTSRVTRPRTPRAFAAGGTALRTATAVRAAAAVAAAVAGAVAVPVPAGASAAAASAAASKPTTAGVSVVMTDAGFALPATIRAGWITFTARTPDAIGHQLEGFRPHRGVPVSQVVHDIHNAASPDPAISAAGTRAARADADLVGGPAVDPVTAVSVTVPLHAGTYHFFDFNDPFVPGQRIRLHTLRVTGPFRVAEPQARQTIRMAMTMRGPRFRRSTPLGTGELTRVVNSGPEIHELLLTRVKPGTTDADVQRYYDSGSTDAAPYAAEPGVRGVAAMSPGRVAYLRIAHLAPGPYVLLCYAGDEDTGVPHVLEGMHRVIRYRR